VRQRDLAGLQAGLVGDVALGGEGEPDGRVLGLVVLEQVLLGGLVGALLGRLLDVREQRLGRLEGLGQPSQYSGGGCARDACDCGRLRT